MSEQATDSGKIVVALPPEIDVTNSAEVYQALVAALAPGVRTVIADLTQTSFCDSSGVNALIRAHERAAKSEIALRLAVPPRGPVHRVLELIGAVSIVPVHSTVAEAMQGP